jgi:alkaline phosphatase D
MRPRRRPHHARVLLRSRGHGRDGHLRARLAPRHGGARVQVEYALSADLAGATLTPPVDAVADSDFTVTVELTGLAPGWEYFYRGVAATTAGAVRRGATGRFRTPPASGQEFRLGWSGDMDALHQPFTLLDRVAAEAPDLFLFVGDTI